MSLFVSIDLETLGLGRKAPIIEFGAILADWMTGEIKNKFHTYVTHPNYDNCEPYAMSMHSTILRRIAVQERGYTYTPIYKLIEAFDEWCSQNDLDRAGFKITLAGKNLSTFDLPMLEHQCDDWFGWFSAMCHHRVIDPGNLFWHPWEDDKLPDSDTCRKRAHIERLEEEKHNALEDAEDVVKMICVHVGRVSPSSALVNVNPYRFTEEN